MVVVRLLWPMRIRTCSGVGAVLQQVGGERVTERMAGRALRDAATPDGCPDLAGTRWPRQSQPAASGTAQKHRLGARRRRARIAQMRGRAVATRSASPPADTVDAAMPESPRRATPWIRDRARRRNRRIGVFASRKRRRARRPAPTYAPVRTPATGSLRRPPHRHRRGSGWTSRQRITPPPTYGTGGAADHPTRRRRRRRKTNVRKPRPPLPPATRGSDA
jgi:hypothetical protein